jgi:hypothetical protein
MFSFVTARTSTVELSDRTQVVLRPVVPEDKTLVVEAFERLSPESRYRRFFSPVPARPRRCSRGSPSSITATTSPGVRWSERTPERGWPAFPAMPASPTAPKPPRRPSP